MFGVIRPREEIRHCDELFSDYEMTMARELGWPELDELRRARRAYFELHAVQGGGGGKD